MGRVLSILSVLVSLYSCTTVQEDIKPNPIVPSEKQIEYQSMEFIGFIHYNLFTFPPTITDPEKLKWWGKRTGFNF